MNAKDIQDLIGRATDNSNAAAALLVTGNPDCVPGYLAVLADSTLAVAVLLQRRELSQIDRGRLDGGQ